MPDVNAIWLGMHRPNSSQHLEDIRYNSDGRSIRYSALALGQPGTLSERCVVGWVHLIGMTYTVLTNFNLFARFDGWFDWQTRAFVMVSTKTIHHSGLFSYTNFVPACVYVCILICYLSLAFSNHIFNRD